MITIGLSMINFPHGSGPLEIYQVALRLLAWDISNMQGSRSHKAEAETRAKALYERLIGETRPVGLSNNEWAKRAGVNTSFFTNLKNGSEPSVGNLRAILEAVGLSLPEFFLGEAAGKLIRMPTPGVLADALREALPGLPKRQDRRAEYLAEVVVGILALPEVAPTNRANEEPSASVSELEDDLPRRATI